jgi:hypothetical protein
MPDPITSFELRIEITGLCLYLEHDRTHVTVVMPDARRVPIEGSDGGFANPAPHADETPAAPHAGYLRFDIANLFPDGSTLGTIPSAYSGPTFEGVHRFDRERVDFLIPDQPGDVGNLDSVRLPRFAEFAPAKQPRAALADLENPGVLMFTSLQGGTWFSNTEGSWSLTGELGRPNETDTKIVNLGGIVHWSRPVSGDRLVIRLTRRGGQTREITLFPTPGVNPHIELKLANLCADNPLEWDEFAMHMIRVADVDFKWLYRLLELKPTFPAERYLEHFLPHPKPFGVDRQGLIQDCFGGIIPSEREVPA